MKVKMVIMHATSGHIWSGDESEVTEDELEVAKNAIKDQLGNLTYIELGQTIIPADLIRNQCVIAFQIS
jgi:hypothetical protein